MTTVRKDTARTKSKPDSKTVKQKLREPTTWAGFFTIAAAVATGGVPLLTDPVLLTQVASGIALVLAKEA